MAGQRARRTDPAEIADVLFWALVEQTPLVMELKGGARFPSAYVRKLARGGEVVHLGTKRETHAVVNVASIVAVT